MKSIVIFILAFVALTLVMIAVGMKISQNQQTEPCSTYAGTDTGYVPVRCLKYFENK